MEGCGTWTNLLNGCLGRRHKARVQSVEQTLQRNPYGRKLMERLEGGAANRTKTVGRPQDGLSKLNATKAPLDDNTRQYSPDLGDLANKENKVPEDSQGHDSAWHDMLDSLHTALKHTRYAVSGRMAMSVWGCSRGARDSLSVICPAESREAVRIWAVSTGGRFTITDAEPDILAFHPRESSSNSSSGGGVHHGGAPRPWRIRIRWLPERTFEAMPKVEKTLLTRGQNTHTHTHAHAGEHRTARISISVNVLTLPALLDNAAGAWADNLARGSSTTREEQLGSLALDVLSILDRVLELRKDSQEEGSGPLGVAAAAAAAGSRRVLDRAFWVPFTRRYPSAAAGFARCGLGLPSSVRCRTGGPRGGVVLPGAEAGSGPAGLMNDAGRSLTKRRVVSGCGGEAVVSGAPAVGPEALVRKSGSGDMFDATIVGETGQAQGQVHQGARGMMEDRRTARKRERRVRWEDTEKSNGQRIRRKHSRRSASGAVHSSSRPVHRRVSTGDGARK